MTHHEASPDHGEGPGDSSDAVTPPGIASGFEQPVRVLHVDDDASLLEMASTFLERADDDATVVTETSAGDGLDRLETERIDCIVSEYEMPGMDGLEFLRAVREAGDDRPFILFTGRGSEEVASEAIAAGVTDYLQKGAGVGQYEVLANRIHNCVSKARAERALDHTEEEYRHLVDSVADYAIFMLDSDGHVTSWNRGAESIKGYRQSEIVGEHFSVFYPEDEREAGRPAEQLEAAAAHDHVEDEGWRLRKDGTRYWANVTITALHDRDGSVHGFAKVTRDMTERREYQLQLERQTEQIEELLRVVAHDLQNPVTVAQGHLQLAEESGDPAHFETVGVALERMATIVDEILDLSEAGVIVDEMSRIALDDAAARAWEMVETGDATLRTDDPGVVEADGVQLQSVLENLFRNAVTHGGDVTVRVGSLEHGFYVADDGPGIPPEERDAVLEYGYSTSETGSGFGLSIVKTIVEAHGWSVSLTESADGGARIEITDVPPVE